MFKGPESGGSSGRETLAFSQTGLATKAGGQQENRIFWLFSQGRPAMRKLIPLSAIALLAAFPAYADMDANGDGKITLEEVIAFKIAQHPFAPRDTNRDGFIDVAEMPELAKDKDILNTYDLNKDGKLSRAEFETYVNDIGIAAAIFCDTDNNEVLTGSEITCAEQTPVP